MLPKTSGFHKVSIKENLQQLFDFDSRVAKDNAYILPLETTREFFNFFAVEHKSDIHILNDEKEKLVGFLSIIYMPDKNQMEVLSIMIHPLSQRLGYGKKIMEFAEKLARKADFKTIMLVTNVKNIPAINFYKNLGYEIVKKAENHYGDGETRYILEKKIC
jgi:ribosomal protein S18 acetylase RimI-like enzyme